MDRRSSTTRFLHIHTDVGAKAAVEVDAVITAPDARVRTLVVTFRDDLEIARLTRSAVS